MGLLQPLKVAVIRPSHEAHSGPGGSSQLQAYLQTFLPIHGAKDGGCFSTSGPPQTQL